MMSRMERAQLNTRANEKSSPLWQKVRRFKNDPELIFSVAYETGKLSKNMKVVLSCNLPENVKDYQHVQIKLKNKETGSFI